MQCKAILSKNQPNCNQCSQTFKYVVSQSSFHHYHQSSGDTNSVSSIELQIVAEEETKRAIPGFIKEKIELW